MAQIVPSTLNKATSLPAATNREPAPGGIRSRRTISIKSAISSSAGIGFVLAVSASASSEGVPPIGWDGLPSTLNLGTSSALNPGHQRGSQQLLLPFAGM